MKILVLLFLFPGILSGSLLDSDPDVVYSRELSPDKIKLKVVKALNVYETKHGKRVRRPLKLNSTVELVGFNERSFQIRSDHVSGWVGPKAFEAKDPKFLEHYKAIYKRQLVVRDLIANKKVAVGMTVEEVSKSLGQPTKTKARRTAKGTSETWQFIIYENVKHYANVRDPYTGSIYRQYVNTTREEKSKTQVEFEDGVATAIEESEDNSRGRVKSVSWPIILTW